MLILCPWYLWGCQVRPHWVLVVLVFDLKPPRGLLLKVEKLNPSPLSAKMCSKSKIGTPREAKEMPLPVNGSNECIDLEPYLRWDLFSECTWSLNAGTNCAFSALITPRTLLVVKGKEFSFTYNSESRFSDLNKVAIIKHLHKHRQIFELSGF